MTGRHGKGGLEWDGERRGFERWCGGGGVARRFIAAIVIYRFSLGRFSKGEVIELRRRKRRKRRRKMWGFILLNAPSVECPSLKYGYQMLGLAWLGLALIGLALIPDITQ